MVFIFKCAVGRHLYVLSVHRFSRDLQETLVNFNASELRPYQPGNPRIFAAFLDRVLGVA